jgi:alpha-tubulin N-acetyltransferase 1
MVRLSSSIHLIGSGNGAVVGLLKVGQKRLYIVVCEAVVENSSLAQDEKDKMVEINPLCALDFYVHESCQRTGFGKQLFDYMLEACTLWYGRSRSQTEKKTPANLGYDRPSSKFISFLAKRFGLVDFKPQVADTIRHPLTA